MFHSTRTTGDPLEYAAKMLASHEHARFPDLTEITVVLPNLGCAPRFAAVLRGESKSPVFLLPQFATFETLAAHLPVERTIYATERRVSDVYHALKNRQWAAEEDLWTLAREVVALVDELNAADIGLPKTHAALLARIRSVYDKGPDAPLGFESALVFELWHALSSRGDAVDAANARFLRLALLASRASAPLYVIGIETLTQRERVFLSAYAQRSDVYVIDGNRDDYDDPTLPRALFVAAWAPPDDPAVPSLGDRVELIKRLAPPPIENITLIPAHGLEHEASNLARVIRHWLTQGKQKIAVIALDRLVVRRLRALLQRDGISVSDETGWALSTTRAAAVVVGLAALDNPTAREQIDYLRSALAFAGRLDENTRLALARADVLRAREKSSDLISLTSRIDNVIASAFRALAAATRRLGTKARPLGLWNRALLDALEIMALEAALLADEAGFACINLLELLAHECAHDSNVFERAEWLRWLESRLEAEAFRSPASGAAVVFTQLGPARLRRFDAIAFAGADDKHLPGAFGTYAFFNDTVRRELGLPHHAQALREIEAALLDLCTHANDVVISWQATLNGEGNPVSRYFNRLDIFHQRVVGAPLPRANLRQAPAENLAELRPARPAPTLPPALLPSVMSASAYNSLMSCPYRFFVSHALRIREPEDEVLTKRDYGTLVHRALDRFHREHPVISDLDSQAAESALLEASVREFQDDLDRDFLAHGWLAAWRKQIPGYIAWQRAREAQGWRWQSGEVKVRALLTLPDGHDLVLEGRIDRIDTLDDNGKLRYAVIDYKTGNSKKLQKALEVAGEDVQLPFYILLRPDADEAAYVLLDKDIEAILPPQPLDELSSAVRMRLAMLIESISNGAPLPAHGDSIACEYCFGRVLCRRDYW